MANGALNRRHVVPTVPAAAPQWYELEGSSGFSYIGYDDAFNDANAQVSASSSAPGTAVEDALDYLGYDFWQAAAGGEQIISLAVFPGRTISYLGIANHNLARAQASIDFQCSDDGVDWASCLPNGGHVVLSDAPLFLVFAPQARNYFRLVMQSVTAPLIGVLMAGQALRLQRSVYIGHSPAPFQRDVRVITNQTDAGRYVGRSVVRGSNMAELSLKRLSRAWLRAYWQPFALWAETKPFFFLWKQDAYPDEAFFGWTEGAPKPQNDHVNFMSVQITMRGNA